MRSAPHYDDTPADTCIVCGGGVRASVGKPRDVPVCGGHWRRLPQDLRIRLQEAVLEEDSAEATAAVDTIRRYFGEDE